MNRLAILLGAGNAILAIVLGAFGAHALRNSIPERMLEIYHTAVNYHLYHALGLLLVGLLLSQQLNSELLKASVWIMQAGIIIFCGSLYLLSISQISWLGAITPIGGIAFIISWALVFVTFIKIN